jgi:hypothetical protein
MRMLAMGSTIEAWEDEGGAAGSPLLTRPQLLGTQSQVDWAERIRTRVDAEFDRVANAFVTVAGKQTAQDRADTTAVIAILGDIRAEVMAKDKAGYFIHDWQSLSDQVRQMIARDLRYQAIQAGKALRRRRI